MKDQRQKTKEAGGLLRGVECSLFSTQSVLGSQTMAPFLVFFLGPAMCMSGRLSELQ